MRIEYELTKEDFLNNLRCCLQRPTWRKQVEESAVRVALGVTAVLLAGLFLGEGLNPNMAAFGLGTFFVVCFAAQPWMRWRYLRAAAAQYSSPAFLHRLGPHIMELREEDVLEHGSHWTVTARWDLVANVIELETHLFLELQDGSDFVIPRRAFATPADEEEFLAELRRHTPASAWPEEAAED